MKPRELSASETLQSIIQLAAWTRKEGKSRSGGLTEKGRKSYERENPGSDLKAPSKEAGNPRRASFCARMSGMKKKLTSSKTANDPDSRINKSLKAWNCSAREELNTILFAKKGGDYKRHWSQKKTDRKGKKKRADRGETPCECHTYSAREELEVIQFGNAMPDQLSDEQKTSLWAHLQKKGITKDRLRDTVLKMRKATAANQQLSARDQLNTILFAAGDWRDRASDNAGAIAAASGGVGALSTYVRGGIENSANWKNKRRGVAALAGGVIAGTGGYAISKLLKKDKPAQAQMAGRIGSGHQNSLSAREELEVIQFGLGSLFTGAGKRLGNVAGELAMPDALGGLGGQLVQGAKFATMGGVRGITSGLKAGAEDAGGAIKNLWGKVKPAKSAYAPGMNPFQNSMVHASARDQLNTILMGVDVRPRDPMGRFDQAEDGAPNPQHMKVTYGQAAATGAAGVGAGVGLKALYDKLKSMKKK